jgi:hypothetical protein
MYHNLENYGKSLKKIDLERRRKLKRKMVKRND